MHNSSLSLGFYYHIQAVQHGAKIRVPGFIGRFIDTLARQCTSLTCFFYQARTTSAVSRCDYSLCGDNIHWVSLGPPRSALACSFFPFPILRHIRPYRDQLDAVLLRGPSPLLPAFARAMGDTPVALLLVGDYVESSASSGLPVWRKLPDRLWSKWYTQEQTRVASHSLTFVNSHKLYSQLRDRVPNLLETRTTTLESSDFFERADTCLQRPVRLLYTGRYSDSKGLPEIVDALAILVSQGRDVVLDLVGWAENREEDTLPGLLAYASKKEIAGRLFEHGYQPVGPALFAFYRQADIFVNASRSSFEGFPRTIWEAMANSLPVVATRVGSIPAFVGDQVELVEPCQPEALADRIARLIDCTELRQKNIKAGRQLAYQNTLEMQTGPMTDEIKLWLQEVA